MIGNVLEDEARDRGIEAGIRERERLRGGAHVPRPATTLGRDPKLRARRIDPGYLGAEPDREPRDLAFAGADVDDARCALQALGREREDLLLILGIDTVGETVLPPARVLLPEIRRRRFRLVFGHAAG